MTLESHLWRNCSLPSGETASTSASSCYRTRVAARDCSPASPAPQCTLYSDPISRERKMSKWCLWALLLALCQSHPSLLLHREASHGLLLTSRTRFQQPSPVSITASHKLSAAINLLSWAQSTLKSRRAAALRSFCWRLLLATLFFPISTLCELLIWTAGQ